jgi:TonB family protein
VHSASVADFYPAEARRKGLDGLVTVDLFVNELGLVVEAKVLTESPKGQGFGLAALDVAKTYEFENTLKKLVLISMTIQFQP